jgi:hypothetical protein
MWRVLCGSLALSMILATTGTAQRTGIEDPPDHFLLDDSQFPPNFNLAPSIALPDPTPFIPGQPEIPFPPNFPWAPDTEIELGSMEPFLTGSPSSSTSSTRTIQRSPGIPTWSWTRIMSNSRTTKRTAPATTWIASCTLICQRTAFRPGGSVLRRSNRPITFTTPCTKSAATTHSRSSISTPSIPSTGSRNSTSPARKTTVATGNRPAPHRLFPGVSYRFLPIAVSTYFSLRHNNLHFYPIDSASHPPRCHAMTPRDMNVVPAPAILSSSVIPCPSPSLPARPLPYWLPPHTWQPVIPLPTP